MKLTTMLAGGLALPALFVFGCSGSDSGGETTGGGGDDIVVENSAPVIKILKPRDGAVVAANEAIIFSASVSDDHDATDALSIIWNSDLVANPLSEVPANSLGTVTFEHPGLAPGEHVITVGATDSGGKTGSDVITITVNEAPSAPEVSISPVNPTTADDLVATLTREATDPNRASSELTYSYRWFKGGTFANVTTASVPAAVTAKGDVWEVRVTALDGVAEGAEATAIVTVGNSAPSCTAASIFPSGGDTTTEFNCVCTGWRDPDDDSAVDRCAFFDGVAPIPGDGSCVLPADKTQKGMDVVCEYTPSDGEDDGEVQTSSSVPILNAPPTVPAATLTPAVADATTELTCSLGAASSDPDQDSLTYAVGWLVDGYLNPDITQSTIVAGALKTATNTAARRGSRISCQLVASDDQASSAPGVSEELILGNAAPALGEVAVMVQGGATHIDEGAILECVVGSSSDADDDPITLTFAWFVNGTEVTGVTGNALTGQDFARGDSVTCAASASDGQGGVDGPKTSKTSVTIGNALPTLSGATISPSQPSPFDLLTCTPEGWFDPDGDALEVNYSWYISDGSGGLTPIVGVTGGTMTPSSYQPGTHIVCEVTPKNGNDLGQTVQSAPVVLVAPSPTAPIMTIAAPNGAHGAVRCDFVEQAAHFGGTITYTYFWIINGGTENEGGASVTGLTDCDLVSCRAVASDGTTSLSSDPAELLLPVGDDCATGDVCRQPTCDDGGGCGVVMASDLACNDGDPCTTGDHCQVGNCVAGGAADAGTPCDDGLFCTEIDTCDGAGACVGGDDPCTGGAGGCLVGACDDVNDECIVDYKDEGATCDDNNGCTIGDHCSANGVCLPGAEYDCSGEGDTCNNGVCSSLSATDHECVTAPKAAGVSCDGTDVCLDNYTCDGEGNCVNGTPRDCAAEIGDDCNGAFCDGTKTRDRACRPIPKATGTACDDGNVCTLTDECSNGVCVGSGDACVEEQINASVLSNQQPSVVSLGFGRYLTQWWGTADPSAQLRFSDAQGGRENEQTELPGSTAVNYWSTRMASRPGGDVLVPYHQGNTYARRNDYGAGTYYTSDDLRGRALGSYGDVLVDGEMLDVSVWGRKGNTHTDGWVRFNQARFLTLVLQNGDFAVCGMTTPTWGGSTSSTGGRLAARSIWLLPPTGLATVGTPVELVPDSEVADGDYWDARMTTDGSGNFYVVWVSPDKKSIKGRRYQPTGQPASGSTNPWTLYVAADDETLGDVRVVGQSNSNFAVIWESAGGDGDGVGIFGQRFDSEATTLGERFRVNSDVTGDQRLGELGVFSDNGFLVVFDDENGDSDGWSVKARLYSSNGSAQGGVLDINTYTAGAQYKPTVEVLDGDDWVVAFIDDTGKVWTRVFQQDGTPVMGQVERRLNQTTVGKQSNVRAAVTATGRVLAVYESPVWGKENGEILARPLNPIGPVLGDEFQVNQYDVEAQRNPEIAGGQSHFAVVWQSTEQDGSDEGVYARFFDDTGAPATGELRVNDVTDGFQRRPSVAMLPSDSAVVVWGGQAGSGSIADIFGRVIAVDGTPGQAFVVNDDTTGKQERPAVATDDAGNLFVAWQSTSTDGTGLNIWARKLSSNGQGLTPSVMINSHADQDQTKAAIAVTPAGDRVTICWESLSQDIENSLGVYCQVLDGAFSPKGSETRIHELVVGEQRDVTVRYLTPLGPGLPSEILVGWDSEGVDSEGTAVQYRRLTAQGLPSGPRIIANRTWAANQDHIELVPLSGSGLIALWQSMDQDGDDYGIYFRMLSSY